MRLAGETEWPEPLAVDEARLVPLGRGARDGAILRAQSRHAELPPAEAGDRPMIFREARPKIPVYFATFP